MRPKLDSRRVALAALSGLMIGGSCKGAGTSPSPAGAAAAPSSGAVANAEKACCKGLNDCKGKGGCGVPGKHDCAGKNECKGQGGCNMHCPK